MMMMIMMMVLMMLLGRGAGYTLYEIDNDDDEIDNDCHPHCLRLSC